MSVMDYYYETFLLDEQDRDERDRGGYPRLGHTWSQYPLKHNVQVEELRDITFGEVLGFADIFERKIKEMTFSKAKMTNFLSSQDKTPYKALPSPQVPKTTLSMEEKKVQCFKCTGFGHYARECPN